MGCRWSPFLFLFLFLLAQPLEAGRERISSLTASEHRGTISVAFQLVGAFRESRFQRDLESGLPVGFTYEVELTRARPNWFDDTLVRARIEVIATFNSSTREYLVNYRRNRMLVWSRTLNDSAGLEAALTSIDEPDLFLAEPHPISKLRVRVRAEVGRGYFLWFIPSETSTNWKEVRVGRRSQT